MFGRLGKELVVPETNRSWLLTGVDQLRGRDLMLRGEGRRGGGKGRRKGRARGRRGRGIIITETGQ